MIRVKNLNGLFVGIKDTFENVIFADNYERDCDAIIEINAQDEKDNDIELSGEIFDNSNNTICGMQCVRYDDSVVDESILSEEFTVSIDNFCKSKELEPAKRIMISVNFKQESAAADEDVSNIYVEYNSVDELREDKAHFKF